MSRKRPKCFIAIAFDHPDTDALCKNFIEPIIKKYGFSPRRVDRIVHNDYIDRKILQEIKDASIFVADLTYARQSVYYETGYAETNIPVLLTCRKDHTKGTSDDLKIHFDLRQRNITLWRDEKDDKFLKLFSKKFAQISKPILQRYLDNENLIEERREFAKKSPSLRLSKIFSGQRKFLRKNSFKEKKYKPTFLHQYSMIDEQYLPNYYLYLKRVESTLIIIDDATFKSTPSKKDLERELLSSRYFEEHIPKDVLSKIDKIRRIKLMNLLGRINKSSISGALNMFDHPSDIYYIFNQITPKKINDHNIKWSIEFIISQGIKSESDFLKQLSETLSEIKVI